MGVKRWLLLLLMGLAVLAVAVAAIPRAVNTPAMWAAIDRVRQWGTPTAQAVIGLAAGGLLVALAVLGLNRSLLSAYRPYQPDDVVDIVYRHRQRQRGPKVVAIGGGHGLNTLLRGLKAYTDNITAIVTVADDGGSSGRLRRDMGMLPPGDFRNCLAALSDSEGLVSQLFQYRFGDDTDLSGHSFGNLYLTAMTAITGSFEAALAESSRVLVVRGRVMPSTLAQVTLSAEVTLPPGVQGEVDNRIVQVRGESKITGAGARSIASSWIRRIRRPIPQRSARSWTPTWWWQGQVACTPACCPTCSCRTSPQRARPRRLPGYTSAMWPRRQARRRDTMSLTTSGRCAIMSAVTCSRRCWRTTALPEASRPALG
jgi:hypothetical protein